MGRIEVSIKSGQAQPYRRIHSKTCPSADPHDNAMAESFFATLDVELLAKHRFSSHIEARLGVFRYIEGWYNPYLLHSTLRKRSPVRF